MKTCPSCGDSKPLDAFYGGVGSCKACKSIQRKQRYATDDEYRQRHRDRYHNARRVKKLLLWDYLKTHPCIDCGESDPIVLEFDHRDRADKSWELSEITRGKSIKTMWEEVAKCDVRCANCHRKKTYLESAWEMPYVDYGWKDIANGYSYQNTVYGPAYRDQHAEDAAVSACTA